MSEKAAKKILKADICELLKTEFKQLIADVYMTFHRIRRGGVHSQGIRRGGCTNALTQVDMTIRTRTQIQNSTQRHHQESEKKSMPR